MTEFLQLLYMIYYAFEEKLKKPEKKRLIKYMQKAHPFLVTIPEIDVTNLVDIVTKATSTGDAQEASSEIWELCRQLKAYVKTSDEDKESLDIISAWANNMRSDSKASYNKLMEGLSFVKDSFLSSVIKTGLTKDDQKSDIKEIKKIVKKVTKRNDTKLTSDEYKALNKKHPDIAKKYRDLTSQINRVVKIWIRDYVKDSKKSLVDYTKMLRELAKTGITHTYPKEFRGLIDAYGKAYTKAGLLVGDTGGLPRDGVLKMNPKYNPNKDNTYIFSVMHPGGSKEQQVYSNSHNKKRKNKSDSTTKDLAKQLPSVRTKWRKDLKSKDPKTRMIAVAIETVYRTSARIGSSTKAGSAKGKTYGLLTVLKKHVKMQGSAITFTYKGKSQAGKDVKQVNKIVPDDTIGKLLTKYFKSLLKGKEADDFIWVFDTGRKKPTRLLSRDVNNYLKHIGFITTIKDMRKINATHIFMQAVKDGGKINKPTKKKVMAKFTEYMTLVAEELGHYNKDKTSINTAMKTYVDSYAITDFFDEYNVEYPSIIKKIVKGRDE